MSKEAMRLALGKIKSARDCHFAAIDTLLFEAEEILEEALAEQPARPYRQLQDNGSKYFGESWDKAEQPAQQEPVAWMTEERYAEMHTSKWTPKIQQVFSKDGILESQTIQYAPQSKTVPYPLAQRTWLGLTDEEAVQTWEGVIKYAPSDVRVKDFARAIEAKLRSKNNG